MMQLALARCILVTLFRLNASSFSAEICWRAW